MFCGSGLISDRSVCVRVVVAVRIGTGVYSSKIERVRVKKTAQVLQKLLDVVDMLQ
jgi:hypothetical protein